ncbi:hypothetical protein [Paenibacillus anseongense]|nr:hypothetical protein [Paenibacillus anseongense]MEC0266882.1 hypothetical protein [Paenibacillus anseongense]
MVNNELVIELLPDEYWWGGRVADGRSMPYGTSLFRVDLAASSGANQACPLLVSSKGRYVWSEEPFAF